jgi:DnaJ-class molecular chaperone
MTDFYNILDVPETASIDEIKKSYRKMSMLYHPDKNKNNPDATAKFQKISEAYETLGDMDKRKQYDMSKNNPFFNMMNGHGHGHSPSHGPIDELFSNLFGMPMAHMSSFSQSGNGGMGPNVTIFRNGVPVNIQGFHQGMQKPTPIIATIIISMDKILTGTTVPLEIERWIISDGNKIIETETLYIPVPMGMDEGEMIILREKGNMVNETCKGDIKIFVKIDNNTPFKRNGLDLLYEKQITVKEALCGFNFELKYITGKIYTITNNSGNIISNGYKKIIPNMGFSRDSHVGNLVIIFNVIFPEKISEDAIAELQKIVF